MNISMIRERIGKLNFYILVIICLLTFALGLVSLADREQFIEWKSHPSNFSLHTFGIAGFGMAPLLILLVLNLIYQLIRINKLNWRDLKWLSILGTLGILLASFLSTCILWLN